MPNIIEEYMVKLGAVVDAAGISKFHKTLRDAERDVDGSLRSIVRSGAIAGVGIATTFAGMVGAVVEFVDHVAMADQEYRLFALHMLMSKDRAQALKITLDELGVTLGEATFDPELNRRAVELMDDQRRMIAGLGPDYKQNLIHLRDIRFEFTRMRVELKYLAMSVVNDFMKLLGPEVKDVLQVLRNFNTWFQQHLPEISQWLVQNFMPVWQDLKDVFHANAQALESLGSAFTNTIGLLTGDHSIMGKEFEFSKLATAVKDLVHWFAVLDETLADFADLFGRIVSAAAMAATGNFKGAAQELKGAAKDINRRTVMAAVMAGSAFLAPEILPEEGELAEGGAAASRLGYFSKLYNASRGFARKHFLLTAGIGANLGAGGYSSSNEAATNNPLAMPSVEGLTPNLFARLSAMTQGAVSPDLIRALTYVESGGQLNARSSTGAYGPMQLTAGTAKDLGVDRFDPIANMRGGTWYLNQMLQRYHGNLADAIGAYSVGPGEMNQILAGKMTTHRDQALNEISHVLGAMGRTGSVQVGEVRIEIHPPKGVSAADIATEVKRKFDDKTNKAVQRNLAEFNSLSYGYGG